VSTILSKISKAESYLVYFQKDRLSLVSFNTPKIMWKKRRNIIGESLSYSHLILLRVDVINLEEIFEDFLLEKNVP
jgi:hypothetical protein